MNPTFFKSAFDDALFDLLDGHRGLIDSEHAGGFAGRGANASRKFREIIGRVQLPDCVLPASPIDQVVPVRDDVVYRASGVAERNTAIHAARALITQFRLRKVLINLKPIVKSFRYRAAGRQLASMLHESGGLTHAAPAAPQPRPAAPGSARRPAGCGSRRGRVCTRAGKL